MAAAADAARERVLAARAQLDEELVILEASGRAAIDIPAKVKASPAKAAAVVGTVGFVALKGPSRVAGRIKRAIRGPNAAMPKGMLPEEIEKTLGRLGSDGDAVRGVLERDFAAYVKQSARSRGNFKNLVILSVVRPVLVAGAKGAATWLTSSGDEASFGERLAQVRSRLEGAAGSGAAPTSPPASVDPKDAPGT